MNKPPQKLLDQVREKIRLKHYSIRTEEAYVSWIKRFILYHDKKHPKEMGRQEIEAFLSHLAKDLNVASSTEISGTLLTMLIYSLFVLVYRLLIVCRKEARIPIYRGCWLQVRVSLFLTGSTRFAR